ncbi:MAG: calcium-binding protein [Dehalococcoidia bacterium]
MVLRGGLGALLVLLVAAGGEVALSASNTVPGSALGQHSQLTVTRDFVPAECEVQLTNNQLNGLVLRIHPDTYTTGNELILGTAGADVIDASGGRDCILGGAGNDTINGQGGADIVLGGAGDDTLRGGGGNDFIYGEAGDDSVRGDAGTDECDGGPDTDTSHGTCETVVNVP